MPDLAVRVPNQTVELVIALMVPGEIITSKNKTIPSDTASLISTDPPLGANHEKHDLLLHAITKYKIEMLGLAEININFKKVGPTNQPMERPF
jgi:hypothetical protein